MMEGITFLGKHSYRDFGLSLAPGKSIGNPDKEKITVKVPFSNTEYDFSMAYGSQPYTTRELSYPFNIYVPGQSKKQEMNSKRTQILNWLMNSGGKQRLYDDAFPGYYFLAEAESGASFKENYVDGILEVTFRAYPFMISEIEEGNQIWDTFNFNLDVMQDVEYTISGVETITLINAGTPDVFPTIQASDAMQITAGGRTYTVNAGTTENADMPLVKGENELTITGNGTIKFIFYKEMI